MRGNGGKNFSTAFSLQAVRTFHSAMPHSRHFLLLYFPCVGSSTSPGGLFVRKAQKQSSFQIIVWTGQSPVELSKSTHQLSASCVCCSSPAHTHAQAHRHTLSNSCWKTSKGVLEENHGLCPSKSWVCVIMCLRLLRTTVSQVSIYLCTCKCVWIIFMFWCCTCHHHIHLCCNYS